ncbi:unnamed protein product [Heligmosomoides polygyrus]|uniref:BACK domain-containing protein n=1 Tax=Heligmosomoides polygyrus TaxID=6339 RepID=A0A183FW67_HELPZ|nr:unnamed protein product [Heligmosomoides polygyrus]
MFLLRISTVLKITYKAKRKCVVGPTFPLIALEKRKCWIRLPAPFFLQCRPPRRIFASRHLMPSCLRFFLCLSLPLPTFNQVEDLPTSSIPFLLIPCYLAVAHHNTMTEPQNRSVQLGLAKVCRFSLLQISSLQRLLLCCRAGRELYLTVAKYWQEKALEELESIEGLLCVDIAKQCAGILTSKCPFWTPLRPFIIARTERQKAVFGLGYPSIPTMTVDEWYTQRFGNGPSPSQPLPKATEEEEERERARLMRWDEYKDDHRRGWGNTHNKG